MNVVVITGKVPFLDEDRNVKALLAGWRLIHEGMGYFENRNF